MLDALSCDTSVALGSATFDGSVIFAKNSDRHANECQPLRHVARHEHPRGATVRCQYVELPQAPVTWEVIGSRPYWLWGFEMGVNEWGVAIGNEAVYTREPYEEPAALIGMDLVRLGLERGKTADEALAVMTSLVERYGQGGNCRVGTFGTYHNSFLVADPGSAWVLETAGRRWAARRVRDRAAIGNLLTIEADHDALSPGAAEHARAQGWASQSGPFSFAAAYGDPTADLRPRACRLDRARAVLAGHARPIRVEDMQALLRDHDSDGGDLPRGASELPSICMHATPDRTGETAASMVAHLRPDRPKELAATVWTAFGSPCLSVFRPVYPFAVGLPGELDRGGEGYDDSSPWWVFERLQRIVAQAPSLAAEARARLSELESDFRVRADATEREAATLLERGERAEAIAALRRLVDDCTRRALDLARRLADDLAPRGEAEAIPALKASWSKINDAAGFRVPAHALPS